MIKKNTNMLKTNVKAYTDKQLLEQAKKAEGFKGFPPNYWILGVQSQEDGYNIFDDKFYLFKDKKFIMVLSGTTNAGATGLKHYDTYNKKGVAVIKTNEWYHGLWKFGYHRGRMPSLKQVRPIKYYRDWNKNNHVEETGRLYEGIIGINFHTVLYQKVLSFFRKYIKGWSTGCQVANHVGEYYKVINKTKKQPWVTYCLIKEF